MHELGGYYTLDGAAKTLGRSYWQLYRFIRKQHIPTKRIGRSILVRLDDVRTVRKVN